MPKREYDWKHGPAELGPHSLAKHKILREYIQRYINILTRGGFIPEFKITLVDGFAGGGEYIVKGGAVGAVRPGSPVIMVEAVRAAEAEINSGRRKPILIDDNYVFVEKDQSAHRYLNGVLDRRFGPKFFSSRIRSVHGRFEDSLERILQSIEGPPRRRSIFVLDQYGYSGVPVKMLQKIMSRLPNTEIFLTLACDCISAYSSDLEVALNRLRSAINIEIDIDLVAEFVQEGRDMDELPELPSQKRREIMLGVQRVLHDTFAQNSGASFYTPFFITSADSRRAYWFLHLANNSRANDVVKDLHWNVQNHFMHHGQAGLDMLMLGYDPLKPSREQGAFDFAFDDSARGLAEKALLSELPEVVRALPPCGVSLRDLYARVCNTTTASKEILGVTLNRLCSVGELTKRGSKGEERGAATKLSDTDLIFPSSQGRLFSIPELLGED